MRLNIGANNGGQYNERLIYSFISILKIIFNHLIEIE